MSDEKFKLPGSSYDEVIKIIKSYGFLEGHISLEEATRVSGIHQTNISRNNGFLTGIGIIEADDKGRKTTPDGKKLALALTHNQEEEVKEIWRGLIQNNDFLSKMLAAIRIRKGMDFGTLQSHIAYSSGQQKTKSVMIGAKTIIDILQHAGLILERDGQYLTGGILPTIGENGASLKEPEVSINNKNDLGANNKSIVRTNQIVSVNIQIQINLSSSEINEFGPKLKKLLNEVYEINSSDLSENQ